MTRTLHILAAAAVGGALVAAGAACGPPAETHEATGSVVTVFEVRGMDCDTCELAIEDELRKLDGVLGVRASKADAVVVVEIDPNRVEPATIESRIEKLGYEALHDTRHAQDVVREAGSTL